MVTVREDGCERRVTAEEAFLLQMAKEGLEGDGAAGRAMMGALEQARAGGLPQGGDVITGIDVTFVAQVASTPRWSRSGWRVNSIAIAIPFGWDWNRGSSKQHSRASATSG
jgi:hypothetical protein